MRNRCFSVSEVVLPEFVPKFYQSLCGKYVDILPSMFRTFAQCPRILNFCCLSLFFSGHLLYAFLNVSFHLFLVSFYLKLRVPLSLAR